MQARAAPRARVPTQRTKLSQYCHGCGAYVKKPLWLRWQVCPCGIGPVQRDLYSAFLAAHLNLQTFLPSLAQDLWESAETRLRAAGEATTQRANAGQVLPQSMGIPRAGARLLKSLVDVQQEPGLPCGNQEKPARLQEPPRL